MKINYIGRLGNNMFQYVFANILAKIINDFTGAKYCEPKNFFKTPQLNFLIDENFDICDSMKYNPPIQCSNTPQICYHVNDYGANEGKILSLEKIASLPFNNETAFYIDGFFQHKSYYEGKRDLLRKFFKKPNYNTQDTAIHIRLGDYKEVKWTLAESYYDECIKLANPKNLSVFTDEPTADYIQKLKKQGANIISNNPVEDLMAIAEYDKIIISRSSYSWWAAILSNAKKVYYPRPKSNFWSKETPHKDLAIQDPSFIFIDC